MLSSDPGKKKLARQNPRSRNPQFLPKIAAMPGLSNQPTEGAKQPARTCNTKWVRRSRADRKLGSRKPEVSGNNHYIYIYVYMYIPTYMGICVYIYIGACVMCRGKYIYIYMYI